MKRLEEALAASPDEIVASELETRKSCAESIVEDLETSMQDELLSQEDYHLQMQAAFQRDLSGCVMSATGTDEGAGWEETCVCCVCVCVSFACLSGLSAACACV